MAKRRGCIDCHLIEESPGQWAGGRCPRCAEAAKRKAEAGGAATVPHKKPPAPEYVERALELVRSVERHYPRVWQQVDELRAKRGRGLPDWPQWCFMPMAGAYAIATQGRNDVDPEAGAVAAIAGLSAWRVSQGIYRFDETLFAELWRTPVEGDIPAEILERLPEWCCYVDIDPPREVLGMQARGFFVHLEYDINTGRRELRFLVNQSISTIEYGTVEHLGPVILHLTGTIAESVKAAMDEASRQFTKHQRDSARYVDDAGVVAEGEEALRVSTKYILDHAHEIAPLISLTLYLCSTNAEILGRDGQNKPLNRPPLRHTRRGTRMFPPAQAAVWDVGFRLGRALRAAAPGVQGPDRGGTHARPRPHLRRAHWHAFWTGPRAKPGVAPSEERKLLLHWLPPTPVAVSEDAGVVPTIREVKSQ